MNFVPARDPGYRADFDAPVGGERAHARLGYEPLAAAEDIARAVAHALSFGPAFINTMADLDLLPLVLQAAGSPGARPSDADMEAMAGDRAMAPIFDDLAMIH